MATTQGLSTADPGTSTTAMAGSPESTMAPAEGGGDNWWLDTWEGSLLLSLLCVVGGGLLASAIIAAVYYRVCKPRQKR